MHTRVAVDCDGSEKRNAWRSRVVLEETAPSASDIACRVLELVPRHAAHGVLTRTDCPFWCGPTSAPGRGGMFPEPSAPIGSSVRVSSGSDTRLLAVPGIGGLRPSEAPKPWTRGPSDGRRLSAVARGRQLQQLLGLPVVLSRGRARPAPVPQHVGACSRQQPRVAVASAIRLSRSPGCGRHGCPWPRRTRRHEPVARPLVVPWRLPS
jgi:hypothetical protein